MTDIHSPIRRGGDPVIHTQEVPLPDMPQVLTLWAVHVEGPDDVLAAASKAEAEKTAAQYNDWYAAVIKRPDHDPEAFPRIHAEVIEWPYARDGHAEALAEQAEDDR